MRRTKHAKARPVLSWLSTEPGFARLGEQADRLARLQEDVARALPGMALTVVAFEQGRLVVGAAHAAVAAKVRQVEPTLIAALKRRGWSVDTVKFKPQWRPPPLVRVSTKETPDAGGVVRVAELSLAVTHPKLREALARMARRHGADPDNLKR